MKGTRGCRGTGREAGESGNDRSSVPVRQKCFVTVWPVAVLNSCLCERGSNVFSLCRKLQGYVDLDTK